MHASGKKPEQLRIEAQKKFKTANQLARQQAGRAPAKKRPNRAHHVCEQLRAGLDMLIAGFGDGVPDPNPAYPSHRKGGATG